MNMLEMFKAFENIGPKVEGFIQNVAARFDKFESKVDALDAKMDALFQELKDRLEGKI